MAWISLHDTVKGKKLRNLEEAIGCSQNEALGLLAGFWLWGLYNANPDGLIPSAKRRHIANALLEGLDERYSAEKAVEAMISTGWIDEIDGHLYIHDWNQWQKWWYKSMKTRDYDNERKARRRNQRNERQEQSAEAEYPVEAAPEKGDFPKSDASVAPTPVKKAKNDYPTGFEEFWGAYPQGRRVGKGEAYKCYKARLNDGWTPEELLQAARNYADSVAKAHTEPRYMKHPKTFLSADTPFTDFLPGRGAEAAGGAAYGAAPYGPPPEFCDNNPFAEWE